MSSEECKKNPNSQGCEKPYSLSAGAIAATICVPVMFIVVLFAALLVRAHRLHLKEEKEFANDTEFYKNYDETISINEMPAYPPQSHKSTNGGDNHSVDTETYKDPRFKSNLPHQHADNSTSNLSNPFESRETLYQNNEQSSAQSFVNHQNNERK